MQLVTISLGCVFLCLLMASGEGQKESEDPGRFVIVFKDNAKEKDAKAVNKWLKEKKYKSSVLGSKAIVIRGKLSKKRVDRLLRNKKIKEVFEDFPVRMGESCDVRLAIDTPQDMFDGNINNQIRATLNTMQDNTDIYVIDSGIRATHVEFRHPTNLSSRVTLLHDYHPGSPTINPHGTQMAALAAGRNFGADPRANIFDLRVTYDMSLGYVADAADAIYLALARHFANPGRKSVIIMCFAIHINNQQAQSSLHVFHHFVSLASSYSGVYIASAAGNNQTLASNWVPCVWDTVVCTGAVGTNNVGWSFSNHGTVVDIHAQGVDVLTAGITNDWANSVVSGTSPATAIMGGAMSLYVSDQYQQIPNFGSLWNFFDTNAGTATLLPHQTASGTTTRVLKWPTC